MTQIPETKRWSLRLSEGGYYIVDENENIVLLSYNNSMTDNLLIAQAAPEAIRLIQTFVENVNSGNYKPRTTVKEFEKFLEKYAE